MRQSTSCNTHTSALPVFKQRPNTFNQVQHRPIPPSIGLQPCRVDLDHRHHLWVFTMWPGLTSTLVRKKFPKSLTTVKGHLRQDQKNVRSTKITSPTTPISNPPVMTTLPLPLQYPGVQTQMAYLQTVEFTGKVSTDQTGSFTVTSYRSSKYLMVLYDHDSNAILAEPLTSCSERELLRATCVFHSYLSARGLTPQYQKIDNECPGGLKQFLRDSSVNFSTRSSAPASQLLI